MNDERELSHPSNDMNPVCDIEKPWPSRVIVDLSTKIVFFPIEIDGFPINSMVIFQFVMSTFTRGYSQYSHKCLTYI